MPANQVLDEFVSGSVDSKAESVSSKSSKAVTKLVYATYYARKFEGRRTSSGARYRAKKMTAAHLTLPFGTIVTVTNPANGKSVDVEINDRGPHSKKFSIDVSAAAARALGFYGKGIAELEMSYIPEED
jgi:rare lipoprotein A